MAACFEGVPKEAAERNARDAERRGRGRSRGPGRRASCHPGPLRRSPRRLCGLQEGPDLKIGRFAVQGPDSFWNCAAGVRWLSENFLSKV